MRLSLEVEFVTSTFFGWFRGVHSSCCGKHMPTCLADWTQFQAPGNRNLPSLRFFPPGHSELIQNISELTHLCQVNQSPSESISQIPWHSSFDNLWYCWYSVSIPYCGCCGTSICARAPPPWGTMTASHWHGHSQHWRGPDGQAASPPCETTPKAQLMDDDRGLKHLLPTGWKMAPGNQTNGHARKIRKADRLLDWMMRFLTRRNFNDCSSGYLSIPCR